MEKLLLLSFSVFMFFCAGAQFTEGRAADSARSFKPHRKWWTKPAMVTGYGAASWLCYRYFDARIQDESQEGKTSFKTSVFVGVGHLGLGKVQSISWGATALTSVLTKNRKLQQASLIWLGSLAINSTITDQLKKTFQRHRPYSGDPYNIFDWRGGPNINNSFPSAHTSNAFTTATVFATIYRNRKWVPYTAYALASLVGLSRIYNNAHWASDVLAGAGVGFLSAKAMMVLYRHAARKWIFLPQKTPQGAGITAMLSF